MPAKKTKPDEKPQLERFLETVREIGAGETDEELEKAFNKNIKKPSNQNASCPY